MLSQHLVKNGVLLAALILLSGCIALSPTPNVARNGDVINLNLGGIKRNTGTQLVTADDLFISIVDSGGAGPFNLNIVGIFRAYPDHTSFYSIQSQDRTDTNFGEVGTDPLYPHDGSLWVAVQLASDSRDGTPANLNLQAGAATITVFDASSTLIQTNRSGVDGNYFSLPINIVAGGSYVSGPPSISEQQYFAYGTSGFLTLRPDGPSPVTVGGMQAEIIYTNAHSPAVDLHAVPLAHDPYSSLIQGVTDNGDGTRTLRVMLTNPNGFVPRASWTQGQSTDLDLVLALVNLGATFSGLTTADLCPGAETAGPICVVDANSYYVDLNGDVIASIDTTLANEFNP